MRIRSASAVPGPGRGHRPLCLLPHHGPALGFALWRAEAGKGEERGGSRASYTPHYPPAWRENVLERAKQRTEEESTHGSAQLSLSEMNFLTRAAADKAEENTWSLLEGLVRG